jgi:hypothetical protein
MRIDDHSQEGLVIYWDNLSESVPDIKTQIFDFEGYRLWRADGWTRPAGTSASTGPATDLWKLLEEVDLVNGFGDDTGISMYSYEPLNSTLLADRKRDFIDGLKEQYNDDPVTDPPCPQGVADAVCDTLKRLALQELGLDGGRRYYKYVDRSMHLGRPYFYGVTAMDHSFDENGKLREGKAGDPSSNFNFVEPKSTAQPAYDYQEGDIYVVPNPATTASMQAWALDPNNDDPTGIKVEFRNLPRSRGVIRIYTIAGDMVREIQYTGAAGVGTVKWDLVSRNGQDITSGVYLYSVETQDSNFDRFIGKFVVVR